MNWQRDIEVLTPLFNRGAYQDTPEIRVPSIRGMVRWWFRALGGTADEEKCVFGGMKKFGQRFADDVLASRLVFRVKILSVTVAQPPANYTLPHKPPAREKQNLNTERDPRAPRAAFNQGASFRLEVFSRLGDLPSDLETKVKNALEVWLLLGSLGLRANRGGGNVWPADGSAPKTADELKRMLQNAGLKNWSVALVGQGKKKSAEELRKTATDTIQNNPHRYIFGSIEPRLSSPTKFKIIRLADGLCLLACAPHREIQCEDRQRRTILHEAERLLNSKQQPQRWQALGSWEYLLP
jgi:CRISPR type III-B/RAMP module RAMP protein Cmr1